MNYVYLFAAIVSEVVATSALKAAEGFTRFWPSAVVIVGYGVAFYCLSLTVRTIPSASPMRSGPASASC